MKSYYYLTRIGGKQVTRCQLITFGYGAQQDAQAYAMRVGGIVIPVKSVYRVMNPDKVEDLGPGFIVAYRRPKYNLVVNASFYYAEVE